MKKTIQLVAVTAAALGGIFSPSLCSAADQKIGTVDLQKVFNQYYKTVRSTAALKEEFTDIQKEHDRMLDADKKQEQEWQALVQKSGDQALSEDERNKSKVAAEQKFRQLRDSEDALQTYDRASSAKMHEKERQRRDDIVKEIRGVLDADAKAGGYTLVLDISGESANMAPVVLYSSGVNDLTDSLIKELNAGAPPTPVDESARTNSGGK